MTKQVMKKRPELIQLPSVPAVLKISEIPSNTYVMKINHPFNLTHLAKRGVQKAFIICETSKSIRTVLGEEVELIREANQKVTEIIRERYPLLGKHIHTYFGLKVNYGSAATNKPHYCHDLPKLMEQLDACGFTAMPLRWFMIPIDKPLMWVSFSRVKGIEGFTASQFGSKPYSDLSIQELQELIINNKILRDLKVFICQTAVATGKWMTCLVPKQDIANEEEVSN